MQHPVTGQQFIYRTHIVIQRIPISLRFLPYSKDYRFIAWHPSLPIRIQTPRDKETRYKAYISVRAFRFSESSIVTSGNVERSGLVRTWRLEVTDFLRPFVAGTWRCWACRRGSKDKDPSTRRSRDALAMDIRSRFHGRP